MNEHKDCPLKDTYCIADRDTFEALKSRGINPRFPFSQLDGEFLKITDYEFVQSSNPQWLDSMVENTQIHYIKEHDYFTDKEPKEEPESKEDSDASWEAVLGEHNNPEPTTLSIEHEGVVYEFENKKLKFKQTKSGVVSQIFGDQKKSCNRRGHDMPDYTRKELKQWMYSKSEFHELYNKWKNNAFTTYLKPSIDRIDDSQTYSFDNIQIMTWGENKAKGHSDTRSGKLIHGNKPHTKVVQLDKEENFIAEYVSQNEASRQTGISQGNIGECCKGLRRSCGGYKWEYKEELNSLHVEQKGE